MDDHAIVTAQGPEGFEVRLHTRDGARSRYTVLEVFRAAGAARSYAERQAIQRSENACQWGVRPGWIAVPSGELETTSRAAWVW